MTGQASLPRRRVAWIVSGGLPFLLVLTFLSRAGSNAAQTTYPLIGKDLLGMTTATLGAAVAASGLASVASSSLVAGRRRAVDPPLLLAVGQFLAVAAFALFALPSGQAGLWAGALALGAGGGLAFPSLMTLLGSRSDLRPSRSLALMSVALSASLVAGPFIEAGVLHALQESLRAALGVLAALPVAACAMAARVALGARRAGTAGLSRSTSEPAGATPRAAAAFGRGRPGRSLRLALTVMLTYQVPFVAVVAFGGLLARHSDGLSAAGAEAAFGVFFAASAFVRLLLVALPPSQRLRLVLGLSAAATVAGVAALAEARGFLELAASMALLGVPHGTTFPLASSILAERHRGTEGELARANGMLMGGTNLATVLVPFACGWLAGAFGYRTMFLLLEVPVAAFAALLAGQLLSADALRSLSAPPASPEAGRAASGEPRCEAGR